MLADAIHFGDVGAAFQQRAVDRALVVERQARRRRGEQRRAAAGNEAQHEIVGGQALHAFENAQRRLFPRGVRHGMGGFDDLDALGRRAVAVAGDDEAFERPVPGRFDRAAIEAAALPAPTTIVRPLGAPAGNARASWPARRRRSRPETGWSERRAVRHASPLLLRDAKSAVVSSAARTLARPNVAQDSPAHCAGAVGEAGWAARRPAPAAPVLVGRPDEYAMSNEPRPTIRRREGRLPASAVADARRRARGAFRQRARRPPRRCASSTAIRYLARERAARRGGVRRKSART